jgi:general secretion pathway protein C
MSSMPEHVRTPRQDRPGPCVLANESIHGPAATRKKNVKHLPLIVAVVLISTVCGSGAYWGNALFRSQVQPAVAAAHTAPAPPDIAAAAGLFGGAPVAIATTAFKLKGVIEDGAEGVAIVVEDGKPALAVGIGQQAAPGVTVTEIHKRYVMLDMSGKAARLDLPDGDSVGRERVAAAPATPAAAATPATQGTPATPTATVAPRAATNAPVLAASTGAGAAPTTAQPSSDRPPGLTNEQMRQQYEAHRRLEMEQMERARREAAGMARQQSGPQPTT